MKNNTIANRFAALALCFVLLFAAAPLPQEEEAEAAAPGM